jgi:hypothetical protein
MATRIAPNTDRPIQVGGDRPASRKAAGHRLPQLQLLRLRCHEAVRTFGALNFGLPSASP